jgi:hypothetical protein
MYDHAATIDCSVTITTVFLIGRDHDVGFQNVHFGSLGDAVPRVPEHEW